MLKRVIYLIFLLPICLLLLGFEFSFQDPVNKIELGERLFFDTQLSEDKTISCATCHQPNFAFADTTALSKGVGGKLGTRNTPSVMNMTARPYFFYDGRAATLEEQVFHPVRNPVEMNLAVKDAVVRIQQDKNYQKWFKKIYKHKPDSANIGNALAVFVRSLESKGNSPYDYWFNGVDPKAVTASQIRGRFVFMNKGKCFDCHFTPDFTGDEFRNVGTYNGKEYNDVGRFAITKDAADLGRFKVPGLRNVGKTKPYMHNGMFNTLREVVDFYDNPDKFVPDALNKDTLLQKSLNLTEAEKQDLVNFLMALSDKQ